MKLISAGILIFLLLPLALAQEIMPVGGGSLEFKLPSEYKQISRSEGVPRYGYANASKTAFVEIYAPGGGLLTPSELEGFKETAIGMTELDFPSLKWLKKDIITHHGRKWIQLSYLAEAKDNRIMCNDLYITSLNNDPVFVSFLYRNSESKKYRSRQKVVLQSIKFQPKGGI